MTEEVIAMLFMALRQLPARIDAQAAAKLLGFTDDDMTILMGESKLDLKPLGNPAQNAPKYFSTVHLAHLAGDTAWLDKASNAIRRHHLQKRSRNRSSAPSTKPSTESSTNDNERAMNPNRKDDERTSKNAA